jgi:hypothetical protein
VLLPRILQLADEAGETRKLVAWEQSMIELDKLFECARM